MRDVLWEKLPPLATLLPGGPKAEKDWEKHITAWDNAVGDLPDSDVSTALDRWGKECERYPTPAQIRESVAGEVRSNQRFRFACDPMTGWYRGKVDSLTARSGTVLRGTSRQRSLGRLCTGSKC